MGAHWDGDSKRWYIDLDQPAANFERWLPDAREVVVHDDETFTIVSSHAYVASATTPCQRCASNIEVICIQCESGTASGEPLTRFTLSNIWAMDVELARQLRPWSNFREAGETGDQVFANHCPHCGAPQDDLYFHTEPDELFFDISSAPPGSIRLTALAGTVRLSGEEHFQVD